MNARDLLNRAETILFEGDACRAWLAQLSKRAKTTLEAAAKNKIIEEENDAEQKELIEIIEALDRAFDSLAPFEAAVNRREGK